MRAPTTTRGYATIAVAAAAAVGLALVTQYRFGMQPCPWCVLQRLIFLAVAAIAIAGAVWSSRLGRNVTGALIVALALGGMASALWQHLRAAASASCNLTLADRIVSQWLGLDDLLPAVFAPRASCADAAVSLLGVPYDFWSLALFAAIAVGTVRLLRADERGHGAKLPSEP